MAEILPFIHDEFDETAVVDEIDQLISKYLDTLEKLKEEASVMEVGTLISNLEAYWLRLVALFKKARHIDETIDFPQLITNTLQSELLALEGVYFRVKNEQMPLLYRGELDGIVPSHRVLYRMDAILQEMGFASDNEDRSFLRELLQAPLCG